jgi:hypothetical protein
VSFETRLVFQRLCVQVHQAGHIPPIYVLLGDRHHSGFLDDWPCEFHQATASVLGFDPDNHGGVFGIVAMQIVPDVRITLIDGSEDAIKHFVSIASIGFVFNLP